MSLSSVAQQLHDKRRLEWEAVKLRLLLIELCDTMTVTNSLSLFLSSFLYMFV